MLTARALALKLLESDLATVDQWLAEAERLIDANNRELAEHWLDRASDKAAELGCAHASAAIQALKQEAA